jgi:NTP pyrophosphatase (non-canonical NTP hydrolase)
MEFNGYQRSAKTTASYPEENRIGYPMTMIAGEAGELVGRYSKILRGDFGDEDPATIIENNPELRDYFVKELGDILWGIAVLADEIGVELDEVATINLEKLKSRAERGVIKGSGDER